MVNWYPNSCPRPSIVGVLSGLPLIGATTGMLLWVFITVPAVPYGAKLSMEWYAPRPAAYPVLLVVDPFFVMLVVILRLLR